MARYINRDKFMQALETDKWGFTDTVKIGIALDKAKEDVVPKSEVEKQAVEIEALKIANEKIYAANKEQEAEIERLEAKIKMLTEPEDIAEYQKKYTEES